MRLKEGDSNWNASGIKRRDFRHAHDGPEVTGPPRARKKVERKWCGSTGVAHTPQQSELPEFGTDQTQKVRTACSVCGQALEWRRRGELFDTVARKDLPIELKVELDWLPSWHRSRDEQEQELISIYLYDGEPYLVTVWMWGGRADQKASELRDEANRTFNSQIDWKQRARDAEKF